MNLKKLERYLRVNLLGPGPSFVKKNLPGRGLTKVDKLCSSLHRTYSLPFEHPHITWGCKLSPRHLLTEMLHTLLDSPLALLVQGTTSPYFLILTILG